MSYFSKTKEAAQNKQLLFLSPAKVNLFFRVLYRREDGFHEIASLYQMISLFDTLSISLSSKDQLTCSDSSLPMDESNLVYKALAVFREKTGLKDPVSIHLDKKIPKEAGLGGGSSNAAATLNGLSQIFSLQISRDVLSQWGTVLGSDVPFFFSSGSAYCTGRGEVFESVDLPNSFFQQEFWIAKPSHLGLSTPSVYKACIPSLLDNRDPKLSLRSFLENRPVFYNDLEPSAFSLSPELVLLKKELMETGFEEVVMSGSGTAFFCRGKKNKSIKGVDYFPVRFISTPF